MKFNQLICPLSDKRVDENQVRVTALGVVLIMGAFFITGHPLFPAFLILDFYIRAFTSLNYSPLSWLALRIVRIIGHEPVWISKGPKIFAARLGFLLSLIITLTSLLSMPLLASVIGGTLVLFAFLEQIRLCSPEMFMMN